MAGALTVGAPCPAVGAHITFSELPVCRAAGERERLEPVRKINFEDACIV